MFSGATWGVAALLMAVTTIVLAFLPGSPVKGINRIILGVGSLIIVLGYALLSIGPWDNPMSLTWAPLLLVAGYCVLIPVALLRRQPDSAEKVEKVR